MIYPVIIKNYHFNNMSKMKETPKKNTKTDGNIKNSSNTSLYSCDEYQGLSYKTSKNTPVKLIEINEKINLSGDKKELSNKKLSKDFRVKYKTEKCKFFELNKNCKFGENCAFAHGNYDIREKNNVTTNYKTKKCKQFFEHGYCPYGKRCQFLHKIYFFNSELQNSYFTTIKEMINNTPENRHKRDRLKTFENLAKDSESSSTKIFEEILSNIRENIKNIEEEILYPQNRNRFMSV